MENDNAEQLRKLAKVFNTDKVITSDEIEQVLVGIMKIMASFRKENVKLTDETKQMVAQLYEDIAGEHKKMKSMHDIMKTEMVSEHDEMKSKTMSEMKKCMDDMKAMCDDFKNNKPENGKDADEEKIIAEILSKIELPEYKEVILDDAGQIADKLETLKGDKRLDASAIKNLPEFIESNTKPNGGGWRNLFQMHDVVFTDLANNDTLVWDATNNIWVNGTAGDSSVTLLDVSTNSTTAPNSIYQMSAGIPVHFKSSDGNTLLYLDETNERVGIGTATPTYKLDVFGTASADMINSKVGYNITTVTKPDITSMTATPVAGSGLEIGYNYYHVTYYNAIGETEASNVVIAVTTAGNQQVNLANIPISSDPTVIGRKIYRSKVSEGSSYGFNIATIADNTTTTYSDNFPESSMTGDVYSRSIYAKANTTSKFIALNGTRSMIIDANFTSIGVNAGQNITVGAGNTFFGARTGQNVTYGGGNTFFGKYAGQLITTGGDNNFFGNEAGANTGTGVSFSVGIGASALKYATGNTNNAIGYYNGYNTSGGYNNFIGGYTANGSPLSGSNNNGIGHFGMTASTSAHYNNFFGYMALMNLTTGDGNIAIGHQAGDNITTGNKNIIIGYDIDAPSATTDGQMSIGNLIYATGLDGTGTTVSSGNVGIGTTSPVSKLHVGSAPTASANYGLVSLGDGAFDGTTSGFFTGSANGTGLAMNLASGYAGDLMNLQVAGVSKFKVNSSGIAQVSSYYVGQGLRDEVSYKFHLSGGGYTKDLRGANDFAINWTSGADYLYGVDIGLTRNAAGVLRVTDGSSGYGNLILGGTFAPASGTTAYSPLTITSAHNATGAASGAYKPVNITYTINNTGTASTATATGLFLNATETALNGMTHNLMDLQVGGVSKFKVDNGGSITASSLSASGYFGLSVAQRIDLGTSPNRVIINATGDGVLRLTDRFETNFNRLNFGGDTSSFPALKRNATGLDVRLADDSGYAPLAASIGTFTNTINTANAITATGNAATIPITSKNNIVTNNSAATLTITLTTSGAVNMQEVTVQILDFSAVAQTITWVNTEDSTVTAPVTSNGSTTLPLTVKFIYNSATSKWRTILKA